MTGDRYAAVWRSLPRPARAEQTEPAEAVTKTGGTAGSRVGATCNDAGPDAGSVVAPELNKVVSRACWLKRPDRGQIFVLRMVARS